MTHLHSLNDWLTYQAQLHPVAMDFGLDRVRELANRLNLLSPKAQVVTVAGTNGKGSSTAMLSAIYTEAGYVTGWYSSPHIWCYNERIRINNALVSDADIIRAFEAIDQIRNEITITVFEWGTLAALWLFSQFNCDVIILEVGLGGRLDAVNIIDADVALITAIDVDHSAYLGHDRDTIAREKAGIMRPDKPAVVSDSNPPQSLIHYAQQVAVSSLQIINRDYSACTASSDSWHWKSGNLLLELPFPRLQGDFQLMNSAGVVAIVQLLQTVLPVTLEQIGLGLTQTRLSGRLQQIGKDEHIWLLDIAHNPQSIQVLVAYLLSKNRETHLVFSALEDKDIVQMLQMLKPAVTKWWIAPLNAPRAANISVLQSAAEQAGLTQITWCESIAEACQSAQLGSNPVDTTLVACGSFLTVEQVGRWLGVDCDKLS